MNTDLIKALKDTLARPSCQFLRIDREAASRLLAVLEAPAEGAGEVNLGWFAGFARKHGHHAQADWLDQYRARSSAPEARSTVSVLAEALHDRMFGVSSLKDPALALAEISDGGGLHEAAHELLRALPPRGSAPEAREGEAWRRAVDDLRAYQAEDEELSIIKQKVVAVFETTRPAAPSADKLRTGNLWWNADDWETTFADIEDAYEAATGGYGIGVARLGRATEHDAVWAVCIDCDTTGDGEADDREIRLFATEDEARQALAALEAEGA